MKEKRKALKSGSTATPKPKRDLPSASVVGENFDWISRIMVKEPTRAMHLAWGMVLESLSELVPIFPETGRNEARYQAATENARVLFSCGAIDEQILERIVALDKLSPYEKDGTRRYRWISQRKAQSFIDDTKTVLRRLIFLCIRGALIPGEEGKTVSIDKAKRGKLIGERLLYTEKDRALFRELGLEDSQICY